MNLSLNSYLHPKPVRYFGFLLCLAFWRSALWAVSQSTGILVKCRCVGLRVWIRVHKLFARPQTNADATLRVAAAADVVGGTRMRHSEIVNCT